MDGWIVIPNWDKFQHYKDRHAPWLKDYVDQLDRDEYREPQPELRADCWQMCGNSALEIRRSLAPDEVNGLAGSSGPSSHLERAN